ncbi:hypothetical protein Ancab_004691, partial [Ancistrocladus abbreviatus]
GKFQRELGIFNPPDPPSCRDMMFRGENNHAISYIKNEGSVVNNSNEAAVTHYKKGSVDLKTKALDQTRMSGDFVCTFNDPLPYLDNTSVVEL